MLDLATGSLWDGLCHVEEQLQRPTPYPPRRHLTRPCWAPWGTLRPKCHFPMLGGSGFHAKPKITHCTLLDLTVESRYPQA